MNPKKLRVIAKYLEALADEFEAIDKSERVKPTELKMSFNVLMDDPGFTQEQLDHAIAKRLAGKNGRSAY